MSSLMSTVLLGDYEKVERMLSAITSSTHSSEVVGQEVSAKRVNVITPSEEVKPETDVTMDTEPSEIQDGKPDLTSQMSVDVDVVPDGNQSDSSGLSLESLYDCTTHNCNILHVCAGSDLDDEEEDKSCFRAFLCKYIYIYIYIIIYILIFYNSMVTALNYIIRCSTKPSLPGVCSLLCF